MSDQDSIPTLVRAQPAAREGVHMLRMREATGLSPDIQISDGFGLPGRMAEALLPGPGVSVAWAEHDNIAGMATFTIAQDEAETDSIRRVVLRNEDGLQLTLRYHHHAKHNAVVIEGELQNTGSNLIKNVRDLRSFDIAFDCTVTGDLNLHTMGGGVTHFCYPPYAFQLDTRRIMGSLFTSIKIDSGDTGRSSDGHMPFFWVEADDCQSGLYAGLEWSGLWHLELARTKEFFHIRGGIEELNTTLRPGETLILPRALLGFYEGSIHDGRNAMRRFIRDWMPRFQGEDLGAPVTWNHAWTFFDTIDDEIFRRQVPVCAELGCEWMQIDWGWFALDKTGGHGIVENIGNWGRVDPKRFPNGIEPLADLVRAHGMKYCTWLDPEQAGASSDFAREHPEWMLYLPHQEMALVDFGNPQCQDWWIDFIGQMVRRWGVYKLKWDNNIDPRDYWRAHDDPEHQGLLQIKHIRGLWRVWEEVCKANPDLVLENCSSGGRRFDLGTFARAHIQHGSDFNFHDDIIRNQISGANCLLPTHRVIHTCTWQNHEFPDTYVQTRMGGILRFSQDFAAWPQEGIERMKRHIAVYKAMRHLLKTDFYALFPQPRSQTEWDGWQYHDSSSGEGFVFVFRMSGQGATRAVHLHALAPGMYELTDPYNGETQQLSGESLRAGELSFTLEMNTAALRHLKQIG